nr:hypothetical protein [Tanacetum cinerariifolium]
MDMIINQQVALDEALVPHASRLRIGKSNFRLTSYITSKESTLQLVYDVLRLTPFYKAFMVTVDVPEIYMQEFWATATVHHHLIRFKMDNKKRIVNLEYFREMMHICPRLPGQTFDELLFEEEILAFLRFLGHSGEIKKLTDVNINKLHQPRRSFAAVIKKCLSGKSTGYDSLRLSQAQILWGLYHKKNVDFAYLLWEDFVYQFGVMLPIELTNEDIRNSEAYKEYYAVASGATPPKTKARSNDHDDDDDQDDDNQDDDDQDEGDDDDDQDEEETKDEEIFDPIVKTPEHSDDEGNDDENIGLNVGSAEGQDAEDDEDELYRDVNINLEG